MGSVFTACCKDANEAAVRGGEDATVPSGLHSNPTKREVSAERESDWERLGGGELEQSLRDGLVKCVDSRFLCYLVGDGGRFERMQDLPETAFLGLEDLKKLGTYRQTIREPGPTLYEWLPVAILSYSWLGPEHPDPHAETLGVLVKALEKLDPHGVIIDFTSLPQVPRNPEEDKRFKEGLAEFNVFYSHPHTLVLQVTEFPPGYPFAKGYGLPQDHRPAEYQNRGWCFAEACISSLGKTPKFLCNLSRLGQEVGCHVVGNCMNEHNPPPLAPSAFKEELCKKAFTQKSADLERVQKLYEDAFRSRIRDAENLLFADLNWGPEEIKCFAVVIQVNQSVHNLDLSKNHVGKEGMMALLRVLELHPTLKSLKLINSDLGTAGARIAAEALKVNSSLTMLRLGHNKIVEEGARSLAEGLKVNTALTMLELGDNAIGDMGARSLADALKVNTTLASLDLFRNEIGDEGVQSLAEALKVNRALSELNLNSNEMGVEGARSLAEGLTVNTVLMTLNVYNNRVCNAGSRCLAQALKAHTTLATLNLGKNGLGEEGIRFVAGALQVNTTLTTLYLSHNEMGADGAQSLAQAIKVNTTLTTLHLHHNGIGALGARSLARALNVNTALTTLGLKGNSIEDAGAGSLAEALTVNTALNTLDLEANGIGEQGARALAEAAGPGCKVLGLPGSANGSL